jgi:hypothetical protein
LSWGSYHFANRETSETSRIAKIPVWFPIDWENFFHFAAEAINFNIFGKLRHGHLSLEKGQVKFTVLSLTNKVVSLPVYSISEVSHYMPTTQSFGKMEKGCSVGCFSCLVLTLLFIFALTGIPRDFIDVLMFGFVLFATTMFFLIVFGLIFGPQNKSW